MDPTTLRLIQGAAGAAGGATYVDDVFSTFLYTGTDPTNNVISNGIDLSSEGGLVWVKTRGAGLHNLVDTARGASKRLYSNLPNGESTELSFVFDTNGFTVPGNDGNVNALNVTYASWTFRKAPGFFDVVTYTGNGTAGRTVAHSLGSVPGMIMVKCTSTAGTNWLVYHRSLGATKAVILDLANAAVGPSANYWNNTAPTSTHFTLGTINDVNTNGDTYVAYVFAHDDASFGTNEDESIIKCGSYTATGSAQSVDLGFEPQFLITKKTTGTGEWRMNDIMRGMIVGGVDAQLEANTNVAEIAGNVFGDLTPTGFITNGSQNDPGATYIYIAIRRPHKPPTAGTEVFDSALTTSQPFSVGFPTDLHIDCQTGSTGSKYWVPRLTNGYTSSTANSAESAGSLYFKFDLQNSFSTDTFWGGAQTINWQFRRAPGFFDVVAWTASASTSITHGLGVTPELIIAKSRSVSGESWTVYTQPGGRGNVLFLSTTNGNVGIADYWGASGPTSTSFGVAAFGSSNNVGNMIAYLFATLPGISKVGSYTGTGNAINVDCGFSAGARFILIKRTDSTGDWYVYDSARGIASGNDPYLLLNSSAAEVTNTDYIDPLSSGFTVTSSAPVGMNASGGTYLFLAIA